MRQVFLHKGTVIVKNVTQPQLDDYSVLVAVHYSFVSTGTEVATIASAGGSLMTNVPGKIKKVLQSVSVHGIEGTAALIKEKLQGGLCELGYSCAGQVVAVGKKVTRFSMGDFVACAGAGFANHAEMVCVPENLVVKVKDKKTLRAASLTTIGAIALQGVRQANISLGEKVCVVGLGLIGQLTVQLLKQSGCFVVGLDLVQERLDLAKKMGADVVYDVTQENINNEINFLTERYGVDATIITAASKGNAIINQAMEITRKKGRVVIVGDVGLDVEREHFYKKEIDLVMSCSYGPGRYDQAYEQQGNDYPFAYVRWTENRNMQAFVSLLEQEKISVDPLISLEINLDDVTTAYEGLKEGFVLGVVLRYATPEQKKEDFIKNQKKVITKEAPKEVRFMPAVKDCMRVGIVGAGGFAKTKLMPIVSKLKNACINAIVDADVANSISVSKTYGVAQALTHDDELFQQDLVDAVVISTPHKYHCQQALKALQNGKAVFLEKPMVTDFEQLDQLHSFLQKNSTIPFCVDYNRSFAPFMQKIKRVLEKRNAPFVAHYRMNAGYIAKEHWVQSEVGAGRIIGEACHIIDLFCFLTDSQPRAVSVEAMHASRGDVFPTDNFSAQISFEDGSICTLLYTALGHADVGKERMEIFFDSKAIVMQDYTELYGFGLSSSFNETVTMPDKGHALLMQQFFKSLTKKKYTPPISLKRLHTVAELTLIIDQLACQGGGLKELE